MTVSGFGAWTTNARAFRTGALTAGGSRAAAQPEAGAIARKNNFNAKFPLTFNHKLLIVNE
jgi:hypothetical protein